MASCVWVESKKGIPPIPCEWVKRNYGKEMKDWDSPHPCDGVIWRYNNNLWGIDNDYEWLYGGTFNNIDIDDTITTHSFTFNQQLHKGDNIVLSLTNINGTINGQPTTFVDMSKTIDLINEFNDVDKIICTPEPDDFVVVDFGDIMANVKTVYDINNHTQEMSTYLKAPNGYLVSCDLDVYILKKL